MQLFILDLHLYNSFLIICYPFLLFSSQYGLGRVGRSGSFSSLSSSISDFPWVCSSWILYPMLNLVIVVVRCSHSLTDSWLYPCSSSIMYSISWIFLSLIDLCKLNLVELPSLSFKATWVQNSDSVLSSFCCSNLISDPRVKVFYKFILLFWFRRFTLPVGSIN